MKGPFERLKYDLRRIWECPACGHKVRTDGAATSQFCRCGKNNTNPAVAMKLVGDGPRRLVPKVQPPKAEVAPATPIDVIAVAATIVETTTMEVTTIETPPAAPSQPPADPGSES